MSRWSLAAFFAALSPIAFANDAPATAPMTPTVASDVVKGCIDGFTDGEPLLPGEAQCLETTAGEITADLQKGLMDMVDAATDAANRQDLGNKLMMDGIQTFEVIENLMNKCLKGDAKNDVSEAVAHLKSLPTMGQNIVTNRISIEKDVISAIINGVGKQWQGTGKAIGEILRMVLLDARSTANGNIVSKVSIGKSGGSRRHMMDSGASHFPAVFLVAGFVLTVFVGLAAVKVVRVVSVERSVLSIGSDLEDADEQLVE